MRFLETALPVGVLACCLYFVLHPKARAQVSTDPVLDIFDETRALQRHDIPSSGPDPTIVAALQKSPIGHTYMEIRPERSLLIYDCQKGSAWCGKSDFSFQTIFTEASTLANPNKLDPDGLARAWYASAKSMDGTLTTEPMQFTSLTGARFQLLAITNRMDLASWDGTMWSGAEIHFAYGLLPNGGATPQLTVILEFELHPFSRPDFKALAKTWSDLSTASNYASALTDALKASGFTLDKAKPTQTTHVRLRMNHQIAGGVWLLSQLLLDPKSKDVAAHTAFSPAKLDDQIGERVKPDSRLYLGLWQNVQSRVSTGRLQYTIPDELLEDPKVKYNFQPQGMGTPPGVCNASETVRDVLALQQCTWCHTTESGTQFVHLPNRRSVDSSVPSKFLAGQHPENGSTLHPSLVDLYYGNPNVVSVVNVTYPSYTGSDGLRCTSVAANPPSAVRKFHDVARRTLFLAALQNDQILLSLNNRPLASRFSTFFTE